jgi:hypothetical protein
MDALGKRISAFLSFSVSGSRIEVVGATEERRISVSPEEGEELKGAAIDSGLEGRKIFIVKSAL